MMKVKTAGRNFQDEWIPEAVDWFSAGDERLKGLNVWRGAI